MKCTDRSLYPNIHSQAPYYLSPYYTQVEVGFADTDWHRVSTNWRFKVNSYYHFDFLLTHLIILKNLQVLNVIFVLILKIVCMIKVGKGEFLSSYTVRTELIMGVCLALI